MGVRNSLVVKIFEMGHEQLVRFQQVAIARQAQQTGGGGMAEVQKQGAVGQSGTVAKGVALPSDAAELSPTAAVY